MMINRIKIAKRLSRIQRRLALINSQTTNDAIKEDIVFLEKIIIDDLWHCRGTLKIAPISPEKITEYCNDIADILTDMQESGETNSDIMLKIDQCLTLVGWIKHDCEG